MKTKRHGAVFVLHAILLAGCRERILPQPDFERMIHQEKYRIWEPCEYLPDGRVMQHPPEGTVPRDRAIGPAGLTHGVVDGQPLATIPIPLSVPLVERGRQRYETFCAPCHGILGDGRARVAAKMGIRPPPSLIGAAGRSLAPGRVYQVIVEGYGLMPGYANDLPSIDERWAVVAYIEALGMSRGVSLEALPPAVRERAEQVLR